MPGFDALLVHEVTVSNPVDLVTTDRYGNPDSSTVTFVERARVQPGEGTGRGTSEEIIVDRDTRVTRFKVFLRHDTHATGRSVLTWEGRTLRADGEPRPFYGRSARHHWELDCEELLG